jgi:hypothetical protein
MEQASNIRSSLDRLGLINNLPVEFSIDNRRTISFRCPTIKELTSELDIRLFTGLISLTPEKLKELKINLSFNAKDPGSIVQGLLFSDEYTGVLSKYLVRFIKNAEYGNKEISVDGEKVLSYEFDYIVHVILISLSKKEYEENPEDEQKKLEKENPIMAKILAAQKEAEEKLKKAKNKKDKSGNYSTEEIMLAVSYEFNIPFEKMLEMNFFGVIWYFGYVGKVDAHKLNQLILSSGMSKQKSYNYWLNK